MWGGGEDEDGMRREGVFKRGNSWEHKQGKRRRWKKEMR